MVSMNTDLSSLILQSNLLSSTLGLNTSIERMTTGYKLNHAKDNAAGYSINRNLSVMISSMLQVQQNTNDGIALLETAEGGLEEINNLLERLRSLAMQASNDTYGPASRASMQAEADEIIEEINRLRESVQYNGVSLYGETEEDVVTRAVNNLQRAAVVSAGGVKLSSPKVINTKSALSKLLSASTPSVLASGDTAGAVDFNGSESKTINIDGVEYTIKNKSTAAQTISYSKDSASGVITFNANNFEIRAQADVTHNLIINGSSNTVYGGDLDDYIEEGLMCKSNKIYGGDGNDNILVRGHTTVVYGEGGNDTITGNNTRDGIAYYLHGGDGDDILTATGMVDKAYLYGDAGNDTINIQTSNSVFQGGDGDDVFNIKAGSNNIINGNGGTNTVTGTVGSTNVTVNVVGANAYMEEFAAGETKTIQINGINYTVTSPKENALIYSVNSSGQISFKVLTTDGSQMKIVGDVNKAHNVKLATSYINFTGGNLDDEIQISGHYCYVYGLDGDDDIRVVGGCAAETIFAGDGNDTIELGGGSRHYVDAGAGNDTITNVATYSTINAGDGDDSVTLASNAKYSSIYGGRGTNTLINNNGSNLLISGFGNLDNASVLDFSANASQTIQIGGISYTVKNNLGNNNILLYSYNPVTGVVSLGGNFLSIAGETNKAHNVTVYGYQTSFIGGNLDDKINYSVMASAVWGQDGNDTITVNGGQNSVYGGNGDDVIINNAGNAVYGDAGNDTITNNVNNFTYVTNGGAGDDTYILNGRVSISDTAGNNTYTINCDGAVITGGTGSDTFYVKGDNNSVSGGGGDDYFVIDGDNNTIDGGTGYNYYQNNSSSTNIINVVEDPNMGGLSFTYQGETKSFMLNGKTYTVTNNLSGANKLEYSLNPNTGIITLSGSSLIIEAAADEEAVLNIRGSNNTINGSDKNDRITIEQGSNNVLNGNAGDDTLVMNSVDNSINGGEGNDRITLNATSTKTIDGGLGDDTFVINSDNNTSINLGDGDNHITVEGTNNSISGADGNNTFVLNSDSNTVTSGDGNNRFVVNGASNTVTSGTGNNTLGIQGDDNEIVIEKISGDINIYGTGNKVTQAEGSNDVTIRGDGNNYQTKSGNQKITVSGNSNILGIENGSNSISISGSSNEYQGGSGVDEVRLSGDNNKIKGGDGNDKFTIQSGQNNEIDGEGGNRNTLIDRGVNTVFNNVVQLTNTPFEVRIKVDIGSGDDKFVTTSISFSTEDLYVDFSSAEAARDSLALIDEVISRVDEQLLNIGTAINRLMSAAEAQSIKLENLISSRSTIRDADIAEESSNLIKYQILQNASSVLLASSRNLRAETVLGLLAGLVNG